MTAIGDDHRVGDIRLDVHYHRWRYRRTKQRQRVSHQGSEVDTLCRAHLRTTERQQLSGQTGGALCGLQRALQISPRVVVGRQLIQRKLHSVAYRREQIVEVVRHPAGELPHSLHLLGEVESLLHDGTLTVKLVPSRLVAPRHNGYAAAREHGVSHAYFDRHVGTVGLLMYPVKGVRPLLQRHGPVRPRLRVGRRSVRLHRRRKLGRPVADQLRLVGEPENAERSRITVDDAGMIGDQQTVMRMLKDQAEAFFGLLARGDVLPDSHDADGRVGLVQHTGHVPEKRTPLPIWEDGVVLKVQRRLATEDGLNVGGDRCPMFGRNESRDIVLPQRLTARRLIQLLRRAIPCKNAVIRVQAENDTTRRLENGRQKRPIGGVTKRPLRRVGHWPLGSF